MLAPALPPAEPDAAADQRAPEHVRRALAVGLVVYPASHYASTIRDMAERRYSARDVADATGLSRSAVLGWAWRNGVVFKHSQGGAGEHRRKASERAA